MPAASIRPAAAAVVSVAFDRVLATGFRAVGALIVYLALPAAWAECRPTATGWLHVALLAWCRRRGDMVPVLLAVQPRRKI